MGSKCSSDCTEVSTNPQISGRIINDEIIEYDKRINYDFKNVHPVITSDEDGTWRVKFINCSGLSVRISQLEVRETVSLGLPVITLVVSPKPKKRWF
jgi:hypothetical protein